MYTNSDDTGQKVINARRKMGMKSCGHSEEGEAVERLSAGTLKDLIYALEKITLVAMWVQGGWKWVVPQAKETASLRTWGGKSLEHPRFLEDLCIGAQ